MGWPHARNGHMPAGYVSALAAVLTSLLSVPTFTSSPLSARSVTYSLTIFVSILEALATKIAKAAAVIVVVIATTDIQLLRIFGRCGYSGGLKYTEYWGYLRNLFNFLNIMIKDCRLLIKSVRLLEGLKQALLL